MAPGEPDGADPPGVGGKPPYGGGPPVRFPGGDAVGGAAQRHLAHVPFRGAGRRRLRRPAPGPEKPQRQTGGDLPLTISDTPAYPWYRRELYTAEYREGIYTGYRYYDAADKAVRYPFGHGLSYTTFGYGNLEVEEKTVRFTLKTPGPGPGKETAQVYVEKNGIRQLGGFQKVELAPGEERTVTIALDNRAFQYWNTDLHGWREEGGEYAVLVGSSSRDIRLRQAIHRPDGIPAQPILPAGSGYPGRICRPARRPVP